jgi:hypothetical protein
MLNSRTVVPLIILCVSLFLSGCGGGGGEGVNSSVPVGTAVSQPVKLPLAELRILVLGQSIASNCNEHRYGPVDGVYQIVKDGSSKPASDPFEWADCAEGSVWMPLGKKLIDNGIAQKVTFMPIGVGGTRVQDWIEGGTAFSKLNNAISVIKQRQLTFDFAFWHQGSSDIGTNKNAYIAGLTSLIGYTDANVQIARWLIARHSKCWGNYDPNIEEAQTVVGNSPALRRFLGPNNNLLGDDYRVDRCHLNQKGQEEMASMWLESIRSALGVR